jgi:hypothetical protein
VQVRAYNESSPSNYGPYVAETQELPIMFVTNFGLQLTAVAGRDLSSFFFGLWRNISKDGNFTHGYGYPQVTYPYG